MKTKFATRSQYPEAMAKAALALMISLLDVLARKTEAIESGRDQSYRRRGNSDPSSSPHRWTSCERVGGGAARPF